MRRPLGVALLLTIVAFRIVAFGKDSTPAHPDYVPDEKTATQIAEAVLVAQFGQERVNAQLPLRAESTGKDLWLVQGIIRGTPQAGGNFGVWVNKYSGCVKVMEHMK